MSVRYPINLEPDGEFFLLTFPDIPEAITQGRTRQEALAMAKDALESALEMYVEDQRPIPAPSPIAEGQDFVELPGGVPKSS